MSASLLHDIPSEHYEKAEEIRAYLVHVRGGAPFLSGADCRLLTTWLDQNISVLAITTAIDRVAEKRRAKRTRSRMTLTSCKATLNHVLGKKSATPKELKPIIHIGLNGLSEKIALLPISSRFAEHKRELVRALTLLAQEDIDLNTQAEKAIQCCRLFHEQIWNSSQEEHESLREEAEKELESLRALLGLPHWREMVEEVMRDKLRAQYPIISAQSIWNAINLSENESPSV